MTAPSYIGAGSVAAGTASITVAWPSGHAAGDLGLLCVETTRASTVDTPSGWSLVADKQTGTGTTAASRLYVFSRVAAGSAESSVGLYATNHLIGVIVAFSGVDATTPIEAVATDAAGSLTGSTSFPGLLPSVTAAGGDRLLVYAVASGADASGAHVDAISSVTYGAMSVAANDGTDLGNGGGIAAAYKAVGSGATGAGDVSFLVSTYAAVASILLAPFVPGEISGGTAIALSAAGTLRGTADASGSAAFGMSGAATLRGLFSVSGNATLSLSASATGQRLARLKGGANLTITASGAVAAVQTLPPRRNGILLLTIGADPLPAVTPIVPVTTTPTVDGHVAAPLAAPTNLVARVSVDAVHMSWDANGVSGSQYIVQAAPDSAGTPGAYVDQAITADVRYSLALSDKRWVRVRAELNGRTSSPTAAVLCDPISATMITANASSITTLNAQVAGKADATAVESLEARVATTEATYGVNLLRNAGLAVDAVGWAPPVIVNDGSDPNWLFGRDDQGASYQVSGTHNWGCHNTSTTASGKEYANLFELVPVDAGFDFIASGYLAAANVTSCNLRLYYYDSALAYISASDTPNVGAGYTGGTSAASWQMRYIKSTPPVGAKWMRLGLRVVTKSASGARAHLMKAMIERAAPGQTTPGSWNTGPVTAWAAWNISFNVDGYISGISLASDGRSTAFAVAADIFQVRAPAGSDALTWQAGVLNSRKGDKELKIGAGFGSDPTGKKMILRYGAPVADASASRATSDVWIAENGDTKFGGFMINYGGGWSSGGVITYSAAAGTPATATISVTAGTLAIGSRSYSYDASSVGVTGTNGTSTTFYLYYDDPGLLGGSCTLYASTDPTVTYASDSKVMVGQCKVTFPTSGSGGGGGGTSCVSVDAWVIGRAGRMRAGDVRVGDELLLCDPFSDDECWGVVGYSKTEHVAGCRMRLCDATLTCSTTAPIPTTAGLTPAPDTAGHCVPTRRLDETAPGIGTVESVQSLGVIAVQHITVGDRCFWASDDGQTFILHHNYKPTL